MGRFKEAQIRAAEALQRTQCTLPPIRQREAPAGPFSRARWPFYAQEEASRPIQDRPNVPGAQCSGSVDALGASGQSGPAYYSS